MRKILIVGAIVLIFGIIGSLYSRSRALKLAAEEHQYAMSLATYNMAVEHYKQSEFDLAEEQFKVLAQDQTNWSKFESNVQMYSALMAYHGSQNLYIKYVQIQNSRSMEALPDAEAILEGFKKFEDMASALTEKQEFNDPVIQWRIKNDVGTAIVWQLIIRFALQGADEKDLKPLFDSALSYYKEAMPLAEKARLTESEFSDPPRIVSQNLDFMTRVTDLLDESQNKEKEEQKPKQGSKKGLGDFLSRARAKPNSQTGLGELLDGISKSLGKKFLPIPMKGIGTSRITGGKQ